MQVLGTDKKFEGSLWAKGGTSHNYSKWGSTGFNKAIDYKKKDTLHFTDDIEAKWSQAAFSIKMTLVNDSGDEDWSDY